MSKPDFLIIGAMKSGTSTLAAQLSEQNGIFLTTPKEPNFFSDDENFAKGNNWYESLFATAGPGEIKGEASTHYTKLPTYPNTVERATAFLEKPRIIYIVRNPIHRAISHFMHEWTMGKLTNNIELEFGRRPELTDYGCYGMQIRPWIEAFGVHAIHLVCLEDMQQDPQRVLSEVAEFIGYSKEVNWCEERSNENSSGMRYRSFPFQKYIIESEIATALRRTLVPQSLRSRIKRARSMIERPELTTELRKTLEETYIEDLIKLIGYFPSHQKFCLSYPFAQKILNPPP